MNIGHGFDIHRLEVGAHLVIGGVDIPWTHGLAGHSDADVLIHAVCDALLGAAGLGDIGAIFPIQIRVTKTATAASSYGLFGCYWKRQVSGHTTSIALC